VKLLVKLPVGRQSKEGLQLANIAVYLPWESRQRHLYPGSSRYNSIRSTYNSGYSFNNSYNSYSYNGNSYSSNNNSNSYSNNNYNNVNLPIPFNPKNSFRQVTTSTSQTCSVEIDCWN